MNRKGFTLIEMLGCLLLLAVVLGIGLYVTRGTLATTLSTLTGVAENEIYDASKMYILENGVTWTNQDGLEYVCVSVRSLIDKGYFELQEVIEYKDDYVKFVREPATKVISSTKLVDICE